MTDYREIIRLKSLEFSNVAIANSLGCSRNTVSEVLKLAGVEVNRKMLSEMAISDAAAFTALCETAKAKLA